MIEVKRKLQMSFILVFFSMKRSRLIIIFVLCFLFLTLIGYTEVDSQSEENRTKNSQQQLEPKNRKVSAESLDQLIGIIKSALLEKDSQRLEEIKKKNDGLIRENMFLTMQKCNKILKDAIENELSGQSEMSYQYFQVSQILAEIYKSASNSTYLLDKVDIFRKFNKADKKKYREANKLFDKGIESYKNYKHDEALEFYYKSLSLFHEIGYKEGKANTFEMFGNVHKRLSEFGKALKNYEKSLKISREINYRLGEADSLKGLGNINIYLDKREEAYKRLTDALEIYREIKERWGEVMTLLILGDLQMTISKYEEALKSYEKSLAISREIKNQNLEAKSLKSLGDTNRLLNEYKKALKFYEESLEIFMALKDRLGEANALRSIGDVHSMLDEYEEALVKYKAALKIFKEIESRWGEAHSIISLGGVQLKLFEYENARKSFEESLEIFKELKSRTGEAYSLQGLGEVHLRLAGYEKARKRFEECLTIYREINHHLGEANCLHSLGEVHLRLAEYEKARKNYEASLMIYRKIKDDLGVANCILRLGILNRILSEFEEANKNYTESLKIYRQLQHRLGEAICLQGLGDVHLTLSEHEKAHKRYEEALLIQKQIGDRHGMLESYNVLGQNYESVKNYIKAEESYRNSIQIVEEILTFIKLEEHKTSYFSSKLEPYESLIKLLFEVKRGSEAFHYAERSKARSFLYLLGNKRIDLKHGVPPNLAKEEEELRQEINLLTIKIVENEKREAARRVSTKKLNEQLLQLKQKHSEILEKIKFYSPEYASMLVVNPMPVEEIQSLIRDNENTVLIEYYTAPDATYLWLLDGKQIYPHKIEITQKTLDSKIQEFNSMISTITVGINTIARRSQRLYDFLLKPVKKYLDGKSRIGLVPHGSLHYLPFEALMNKGKFLVEKNIKIFYLPSSSVYKYCIEKNKKRKEKAAAFVNPDGTLPYSKKEAEYLKKLFPQGMKIFSGKDATETMVKNSAGSSDILHFACHGKFDSEHPLYSALLLRPDNDNDGRLEVNEIFQLKLKPAYLVTLSACETHLGKISPGDDIIGLTRAFIYAGTPSILASLWKVDDHYTEKLMASFYRALKTSDKIEALHTARQEIINKLGKRHPFYWAAFLLIGDPR